MTLPQKQELLSNLRLKDLKNSNELFYDNRIFLYYYVVKMVICRCSSVGRATDS